ncbi:hypothetical protein KFK09_019283 [Dendrobium nobile]|uniref:Uncharacterized protein n=1 Tax=Dendrobium nobile TaxID=94219 RepID=A0A8T3B3J4_DENNO|nr:hypothetical protein KFK09_019283 [Dendrobium nobile]
MVSRQAAWVRRNTKSEQEASPTYLIPGSGPRTHPIAAPIDEEEKRIRRYWSAMSEAKTANKDGETDEDGETVLEARWESRKSGGPALGSRNTERS